MPKPIGLALFSSRAALNDVSDDLQASFGRYRHSSVGREFGRYGTEVFLEPKAILVCRA
jgi:hypothetical protein